MGIKRNILYTSVLTTSNYVFPLLVFPYVARVLGVTNIGLCNFVDNIINYFILFSMMGINIMGNREIASEKHDKISLSHTFSSLFTLNAITTTIALAFLIGAIYAIPTLRENKELMWFGAVKLISNFMLIEWFYKGMEEFRYITIRTILVKSLYVISIFLLVKTETDYNIYYLLTVLMVSVNALINTTHSRKYVNFSFRNIHLSHILKPFLLLGVYMLVTSFCTTFNVVFLGFVTDDTQVGYYTTATKLYSILLAFFTGVTSVMLPRMSNLVSEGKYEEFKTHLSTTTSLLFSFSIPIIILAIIFAPQIILLISGPGYQGAITPMRIVMPIMMIIGYEQIIVIQGLMPLRADKYIMFNSAIGAIISIALNIILVSHLKSIGSAVTWISSEFTILALSLILINRMIKVKVPFVKIIKTIAWNVPLIGLLLWIFYSIHEDLYWLYLLAAGSVTVIYTLLIQIFVFKNKILLSLIPLNKHLS